MMAHAATAPTSTRTTTRTTTPVPTAAPAAHGGPTLGQLRTVWSRTWLAVTALAVVVAVGGAQPATFYGFIAASLIALALGGLRTAGRAGAATWTRARRAVVNVGAVAAAAVACLSLVALLA